MLINTGVVHGLTNIDPKGGMLELRSVEVYLQALGGLQ
jgi:hypothetical protein